MDSFFKLKKLLIKCSTKICNKNVPFGFRTLDLIPLELLICDYFSAISMNINKNLIMLLTRVDENHGNKIMKILIELQSTSSSSRHHVTKVTSK